MKKIKSISLMIMLGLLSASNALAQAIPVQNFGLPDLSKGNGAAGLIQAIILVLLSFAGIVAVMFIIIGGFQYIISGANEDLAKRGKTTATNAIIGLIIIILSYTVITVITNTLTRRVVDVNL